MFEVIGSKLLRTHSVMIAGGNEYRDLAQAMTAAVCRKRASEFLTDAKETDNRKPWS